MNSTRLLACLSAAIAAGGCDSNDPQALPPASGFATESVDYHREQPVLLPVVQVADAAFPVRNGTPASFSGAPREAGAPFAIEGIVRVPKPEDAYGVVYVTVARHVPGIGDIIADSGQAVVAADDSPDGHLHFRVELKAPASKGMYHVRIVLTNDATGEHPVTVAEGALQFQ